MVLIVYLFVAAAAVSAIAAFVTATATAAVTMGSIKSAVAFFSQQGKAVADRPKLLQAMYFIISNGEILTPDEIFKWLCSQDQSEVREKFINASVALKLAMNFYKLLPEKNSNNAQKGDGESE